MAVDYQEIINIYSDMVGGDTDDSGVVTKYNAMWDANEIDAETYAELISTTFIDLMTFAAESVQRQEEIDADVNKDVVLTQAELIKKWGYGDAAVAGNGITVYDSTSNGLIDKQISELDGKVSVIGAQLHSSKFLEQAELQKKWGYDVNTDEDQLVVGNSNDSGLIDEQIKESDTARLYDKFMADAALERQWGCTYDSNGVADATDDGIVDKQTKSDAKSVLVKTAQATLVDRQKAGFDDKLRIEEAKARKDVVFGYSLGGVVPSGSELTDMHTAIDKIDSSNGISATNPTWS